MQCIFKKVSYIYSLILINDTVNIFNIIIAQNKIKKILLLFIKILIFKKMNDSLYTTPIKITWSLILPGGHDNINNIIFLPKKIIFTYIGKRLLM